MKECKDRCKEERFPDVKAGDTVYISSFTNALALVVISESGKGLRMVMLESGSHWCSESLWGRNDPSIFEKVEVCFKQTKED